MSATRRMEHAAPRRRGRIPALLLLFLLLIVSAELVKRYDDHRLLNRYTPASPDVIPLWRIEREEHIAEGFTYEGFDGESIPVRANLPATRDARHPAVVFLYGAGMDTGFADQIGDQFTDHGFALIMPEQLGRGQRAIKNASALRKILLARRRALLTGAETRRLLDVLTARTDIDPDRIYFVGASFGAIFGCHAVAADSRFRAAAFILAGGDFSTWIGTIGTTRASTHYRVTSLRMVRWLVGMADPIRCIGAIAPRPVLFQNALDDEIIPAPAARALYEAAGLPKSQRWYEISHAARDAEDLRRVRDDLIPWLITQDAEQDNH